MNHDEPLNFFGISLFFDAGSYGCSSQHIPKVGTTPIAFRCQTGIITSQLNKNEAEHMKTMKT